MHMRHLVLIFLTALAFSMNAYPQTAKNFANFWDKDHLSSMFPSDMRHADLKKYLEQLKKLGVKVDQVGFSNATREIYQIEWGRGPIKVFMWSQMHGDEPTATSALVDMFAFLQKHRDEPWVKKIAETMTIRAVPMLNPDGAEMYQRRNLQGIDVNRDAIDLKTPEGRLLKQLRDDWNPAIGFNLHNQGSLTTVGRSINQATISLLVVYGDEARTTSYGHERNLRIASAIATALQKFIPGHIARYSGEWSPMAFGDNFSAWGTPTILVETGGLFDKDEMFLVKMNFVAFMTALQSLATSSERTQDTLPYLSLAENGSGGLYHFIFRRANIVSVLDDEVPNAVKISPADIAVNVERRRASFGALAFIRSIGDLYSQQGLVEFDAAGFHVIHRLRDLKTGELAEFFFYRKERIVNWTVVDLEKHYPPDAVFSGGKWIKGEKVVAKK